MGKIKYLDVTGHKEVVWEVEDETSVSEANEQFRQLMQSGFTAFEVGEDRTKTLVTEFDPNAREIVMVPRLSGG